jgi:hypothetical protein
MKMLPDGTGGVCGMYSSPIAPGRLKAGSRHGQHHLPPYDDSWAGDLFFSFLFFSFGATAPKKSIESAQF